MMGQQNSNLSYDRNLTTDDHGHTLVYDAWNRLVAIRDPSGYDGYGSTIEAFEYDGLGRRIMETDGTHVSDLYYGDTGQGWQVVEERSGVSTGGRRVFGVL